MYYRMILNSDIMGSQIQILSLIKTFAFFYPNLIITFNFILVLIVSNQ